MKQAKQGEHRSAVYENRPAYADFEAPNKFLAIESIIAKRLYQHPNAICSYSGGSDSDIMSQKYVDYKNKRMKEQREKT